MTWSPDDIGDLTGTTAVVTGANSGIGLVQARTLAGHGAAVTLAVRNLGAGEAAAQRIRATHPAALVDVLHLDLSDQDSVREAAHELASRAADAGRGLDLLINNAGVMAPPTRRVSVDGHELQFATNHLGHFALTGRLLPTLLASEHPRVVTVASIAHKRGDARVLEGNPEAGYNAHTSYGQSKLANLLFARELHRRAVAASSHLVSTAAHPGVSSTNLVASQDGMGANWVIRTLAPPLVRLAVPGPEAGAKAVLYAATLARPGSYSGPQRLGESRGPVGPAQLSSWAADAELGAQLWSRSEELTGVTFDF